MPQWNAIVFERNCEDNSTPTSVGRVSEQIFWNSFPNTGLPCTGKGKLYLCNDETVVVTRAHIATVVGRLDSEGKFGHDNRAGVPGQLHRLSVMRSREVRGHSLPRSIHDHGRLLVGRSRGFVSACIGLMDALRCTHVADEEHAVRLAYPLATTTLPSSATVHFAAQETKTSTAVPCNRGGVYTGSPSGLVGTFRAALASSTTCSSTLRTAQVSWPYDVYRTPDRLSRFCGVSSIT